MAVAPPLVYADQAYSIVKKKWVPATTRSVVTPVDTNYAQGLDRVLSGCLRDPVCPTRFRLEPPGQLTISRNCLARSPSSLLPYRKTKPRC